MCDIIICMASSICGFLLGAAWDSYMWQKMYKKDRLSVICLLESFPHAI